MRLIVRRSSFWLIVILVIVIPIVAFVCSQFLVRALGTPPPAHPPSSVQPAGHLRAGGIWNRRPRTLLS